VPTIGNVYRQAAGILRYYNGLGRDLKSTGWDDERHWLNRAWTLQEIQPDVKMIDGGVPEDGLHMDMMGEVSIRGPPTHDANSSDQVPHIQPKERKMLRELVEPIDQIAREVYQPGGSGCSLLALTREMGRRYASKEVDKIAGLGYLLRARTLPTYSADENLNTAWVRCVSHMRYVTKLELLFNFPYERSSGGSNVRVQSKTICGPVIDIPSWIPSWTQMKRIPETNGMRSSDLQRPKHPVDGEHEDPEGSTVANRVYIFKYRAGLVIRRCSIERNVETQDHSSRPTFQVKRQPKTFEREPVCVGFYSPYPTTLKDGRNYIFVAQRLDKGTSEGYKNRTWLVCREEPKQTLCKRMEELGQEQPQLEKHALVLRKHAILLMDNATRLIGSDGSDIRDDCMCYFV